MAGLNQLGDPDARDPESGGQDSPGHQETAGDSRPYADTDRFGKTQTGDATAILGPRNHITDDVWGVNDTAGGVKGPAAPDVPIVSR